MKMRLLRFARNDHCSSLSITSQGLILILLFFLLFTSSTIAETLDFLNSYSQNITPQVLIIYDSVYGSTELIAKWIAEGIKDNVIVKNINITKESDLRDAHFILLGSPIYEADVTEGMRDFIIKNSPYYKDKPFGLFVVCGTHYVHGQRWVDNFEKLIGAKAKIKGYFGGILKPEILNKEDKKLLETYWRERGISNIKEYNYLNKGKAVSFGKKIKELLSEL